MSDAPNADSMREVRYVVSEQDGAWEVQEVTYRQILTYVDYGAAREHADRLNARLDGSGEDE